MTYDRDDDLKGALNSALVRILSLPERDYYNQLTIEKLIELKTLVKEVNNIVTLRLTLGLAEWLCKCFGSLLENCEKIQAEIKQSKPNANGYDIDIKSPVDVVAEVKCNLPINDSEKYGAQQRHGLLKDLCGLKNGKKRASPRENSFKFLGLYDHVRVKKATEHLISNLLPELKDAVKVMKEPKYQDLQQEKIHIVFIKPD